MFSDHCTLNVSVCKNHGYIGEFSFGFTRSEEGPEILHFSTSSQIFHVHIINHLSHQMISVSNQMFNPNELPEHLKVTTDLIDYELFIKQVVDYNLSCEQYNRQK